MEDQKNEQRKRSHRAKTEKQRSHDRAIGERIALVRMKAGDDLQTFARALGVTPTAVHLWEKGNGITAYNAMRICDVYEISSEWLLSGIGRRRRSLENRMHLLSHEDRQEGYEHFDAWIERRLFKEPRN